MVRSSYMARPKHYVRNRELRGKRVRFQYRHWTNTTTSFLVAKDGDYNGMISHTCNFKGSKQMAAVSFDGNKRMSFVPLMELKIINGKGKVIE